jgi:hypothetical protein
MQWVRDKRFDNQRIPLDGVRFVGCVFAESKLIFTATEPVSFDKCTFISCDWVFEGPALATLQFLAVMYDGLGLEGPHLVQSIFDSIKQGAIGEKLFHPEPAQIA